jgi:hypothetical protein
VISSTAPGAGFDSGVTVQITGVSCSSPSQCLMVDNNGDALTATDPLGGTAARTVQNLIPFSTEPLSTTPSSAPPAPRRASARSAAPAKP